MAYRAMTGLDPELAGWQLSFRFYNLLITNTLCKKIEENQLPIIPPNASRNWMYLHNPLITKILNPELSRSSLLQPHNLLNNK